jgi:hypothetical protein
MTSSSTGGADNTRPTGVLRTAVPRLRWGLPWICMFAVSASIAHAMTVAVAVGPSAGDLPTSITVVQAPPNGCESCGCSTIGGFCFGDQRAWADVPANAVVDPSAGTLVVASTATSGSIDRFSSDDACETTGSRMLYVGLNTWIPAEPISSCTH